MNMPFIQGASLIEKAYEERYKGQMWDIWIAKFPHMTEENYIDFEEFIKPIEQKEMNRSKEDILSKAERIRQADKKRNNPS